MGTITISVDAGAAGTATKTFTVSNASIGRVATWMKAQSGPGNAGPPPTNEQALQRWAQWMMDMSKAHLLAHERAGAAVPDFDVT